jgi:hypothetical protein
MQPTILDLMRAIDDLQHAYNELFVIWQSDLMPHYAAHSLRDMQRAIAMLRADLQARM